MVALTILNIVGASSAKTAATAYVMDIRKDPILMSALRSEDGWFQTDTELCRARNGM